MGWLSRLYFAQKLMIVIYCYLFMLRHDRRFLDLYRVIYYEFMHSTSTSRVAKSVFFILNVTLILKLSNSKKPLNSVTF